MGSWRESGSEITELILQAPRNHSLAERRVMKKKVDCCLKNSARASFGIAATWFGDQGPHFFEDHNDITPYIFI